MGSQTHLGGDRSRTTWTPAMERYFIDLMLDQVHRGNRMGHTFNKQAWNDMLVMFNSSFRSPYDVNVLKSHYTSLWKQFSDVKNLLDQNGFSWDSTRQMVVAERCVWDAYIKVLYLLFVYKILHHSRSKFIYGIHAGSPRCAILQEQSFTELQ